MSKKMLKLTMLIAGGAILLQNGCLQAFGEGFFNTGFPGRGGPRWLNLAIDILNEELLG